MTLELPSLRIIAASSDCKIGFAVARTDRVNVWSSPAPTSPCLYFTLLITEGALEIPPEQLMATIAHELGHLALHHTPQSDTATLTVSGEHWRAIQAQELEADRFAIALLKRTRAVHQVGSCEAMATFLRRSVPDWYGTEISTRMDDAVTQRAASADAVCDETRVGDLGGASCPFRLGRSSGVLRAEYGGHPAARHSGGPCRGTRTGVVGQTCDHQPGRDSRALRAAELRTRFLFRERRRAGEPPRRGGGTVTTDPGLSRPTGSGGSVPRHR